MTPRCFALAFACALSLIVTVQARAELLRLEIGSVEPHGTVGSQNYLKIDGRAHGALNPGEPIPGLERADRGADGRVHYSAPFTIIAPASRTRGGILLLDIQNRGRPIAHALLNGGVGAPLAVRGFEIGTGFLQDRGFVLASVGWELGHGVELPSFTGPDGKRRYAEGAGIAIARDFAMFLRDRSRDSMGRENPVYGMIEKTIAVGYSQSARFLKTAMVTGLDIDRGKRAFDGLLLVGGHAGLMPMAGDSAGPTSVASMVPNFSNPDVPDVHVPPFTWNDIVKAHRTKLPSPKVIAINLATDYWIYRAALARVSNGIEPPIPENVRVYDISGGAHVMLAMPGCRLPRSRLDWSPLVRSGLVNLADWLNGRLPPASHLMPLRPANGDPAMLPHAALNKPGAPALPMLDEDENQIGGIRLPDVAVPLGTNGAVNFPVGEGLCDQSGSFDPFASKITDRVAGDLRRPLDERYMSDADYVDRIARAADDLVGQRLLLPLDAAVIVNDAIRRMPLSGGAAVK